MKFSPKKIDRSISPEIEYKTISDLPFSNLIQYDLDKKKLRVEDITLTHYQVPRTSEYFKEINKANKCKS